MKILLSSHSFAPSVGGIETCSLTLAREFRRTGHEVRIVTQSISNEPEGDHGFNVLRQPLRGELISAIRWCDVFYQNNISLQTGWPLLVIRKPWFVTTQTWLGQNDQAIGRIGKMKRYMLRYAHNIYISDAIAKHVGHPGPVLGNPYDHETFRLYPGGARNRDLVFLGRLVSDKGCDLLMDALRLMKAEAFQPTATIIGDGPERIALEKQIVDSSLKSQIRFVGKMSGDALATELNRHRVIVIPSRWNEPFGIVALEGMACGCIPVVSSGGGLPEATGALGVVFPNGDVNALVDSIKSTLNVGNASRYEFANHLARFEATAVAQRYLDEFSRALQ